MPFAPEQIEDGSGLATAIVYGDEDSCAAYLALRGKTSYAGASGSIGGVEKKMIYLVLGTQYIETLSAKRALGTRSTAEQALLFPRNGVEIDWIVQPPLYIPQGYIDATYEAAELAARGETFLDVVDEERDLKRKNIAGAIDKEWFGRHDQVKTYHLIDQMLKPFLGSVGYRERG